MKARFVAIGMLVPELAWAQVCVVERPDWTALAGAVTPLQEFGYFAGSPLGIALMTFCGAHLWFANRLTLYLTLVAVGFCVLAQTEMFWAPNHLVAQSFSEGCRGLPWVTLPVIAGFGIAAVLWYQLRHDVERKPE